LSASAVNNADLALRVKQAYGGDLDVDAQVPEMLRVERPELPNVAGKAR
jgi:hypothetical protein